jgi:hypothetical protein
MMKLAPRVVADKLIGAIVEANGRLTPVHATEWWERAASTSTGASAARAMTTTPPAVGLNFKEFVDQNCPSFGWTTPRASRTPCWSTSRHGTVLAYEDQVVSPDWIGSMRNTRLPCQARRVCISRRRR